ALLSPGLPRGESGPSRRREDAPRASRGARSEAGRAGGKGRRPEGGSMSGYTATHLSDIEQRDTWLPVREHFGIGAFGTNAYRAKEAGDAVIGEHSEVMAKHEELYLVLNGHATFTVNGDEIDAPAGTLVFVSDP